MTRTLVVTDSTASVPDAVADELDIRIVPILVSADDDPSARDLSAAEVSAALRARRPVHTSLPSPGVLESLYADVDADAIVSIHVSGQLSGTVSTATAAATAAPRPVHVVDSHQVGAGLGLVVAAAARAAVRGAELDEVVRYAEDASRDVRSWFTVESMEHLRRGGRGAVVSVLGAAFTVKPVLAVRDGAVALEDKVRTMTRAVDRLEDLAVSAAGDAPRPRIIVQHWENEPRAEQLADQVHRRIPWADVALWPVSPAVAAHVGPGLVGIAVAAE